MGYSSDEIVSSDNFETESVIQCCCSWRCCGENVFNGGYIHCNKIKTTSKRENSLGDSSEFDKHVFDVQKNEKCFRYYCCFAFLCKYKIKFKYISGILQEKKGRKMIISAFTSSMICSLISLIIIP